MTSVNTADATGVEVAADNPAAENDAQADAARPRDESAAAVAEEKTPRRWRRARLALAAALTFAAASAAVVSYLTIYTSDEARDNSQNSAILAASDNGTAALLSYSPQTIDADFAKAKGYLTGQFLSYYSEFTAKVVKPAATDNSVVTRAQVVRSAVSSRDGDDATVLAFINQSTTTKTSPDAKLTSSSVSISMHRSGGTWRISSFDPV